MVFSHKSNSRIGVGKTLPRHNWDQIEGNFTLPVMRPRLEGETCIQQSRQGLDLKIKQIQSRLNLKKIVPVRYESKH